MYQDTYQKQQWIQDETVWVPAPFPSLTNMTNRFVDVNFFNYDLKLTHDIYVYIKNISIFTCMSNIHGLFKIRQYTSHTSREFPLL